MIHAVGTSLIVGCAALGVGLGLAAPAVAASGGRQPVVVELFTSQGCSSCPPANANLATVSDRPGVLALSFGVTYWDRLGWKDIFARPDYTDRQVAYETPLGEDGPFTPQVVIGGRTTLVGNHLDAVDTAIAADAARLRTASAPDVALSGRQATVGPGEAPREGADVWLVRYDPRLVKVAVKRGENAGATLPHKNVVHDLVRLGRWTGMSATFAVSAAPEGQRTAVLVQAPSGGPILAAVTD